eukprot:PLAT12407.1.p1 GENE.PLAT12407.1~~PLAT12407.1.p1  ORF type:complete len:607 (+),score=78.41 PLAT12407.1:125-1945(+)
MKRRCFTPTAVLFHPPLPRTPAPETGRPFGKAQLLKSRRARGKRHGFVPTRSAFKDVWTAVQRALARALRSQQGLALGGLGALCFTRETGDPCWLPTWAVSSADVAPPRPLQAHELSAATGQPLGMARGVYAHLLRRLKVAEACGAAVKLALPGVGWLILDENAADGSEALPSAPKLCVKFDAPPAKVAVAAEEGRSEGRTPDCVPKLQLRKAKTHKRRQKRPTESYRDSASLTSFRHDWAAGMYRPKFATKRSQRSRPPSAPAAPASSKSKRQSSPSKDETRPASAAHLSRGALSVHSARSLRRLASHAGSRKQSAVVQQLTVLRDARSAGARSTRSGGGTGSVRLATAERARSRAGCRPPSRSGRRSAAAAAAAERAGSAKSKKEAGASSSGDWMAWVEGSEDKVRKRRARGKVERDDAAAAASVAERMAARLKEEEEGRRLAAKQAREEEERLEAALRAQEASRRAKAAELHAFLAKQVEADRARKRKSREESFRAPVCEPFLPLGPADDADRRKAEAASRAARRQALQAQIQAREESQRRAREAERAKEARDVAMLEEREAARAASERAAQTAQRKQLKQSYDSVGALQLKVRRLRAKGGVG